MLGTGGEKVVRAPSRAGPDEVARRRSATGGQADPGAAHDPSPEQLRPGDGPVDPILRPGLLRAEREGDAQRRAGFCGRRRFLHQRKSGVPLHRAPRLHGRAARGSGRYERPQVRERRAGAVTARESLLPRAVARRESYLEAARRDAALQIRAASAAIPRAQERSVSPRRSTERAKATAPLRLSRASAFRLRIRLLTFCAQVNITASAPAAVPMSWAQPLQR